MADGSLATGGKFSGLTLEEINDSTKKEAEELKEESERFFQSMLCCLYFVPMCDCDPCMLCDEIYVKVYNSTGSFSIFKLLKKLPGFTRINL